ncbi:terminase small subunit [Paenibacillus nicotianae]|uniref:Terminase small subunit n=1 Tax=Paenibacillus nicotianae TaxID=1526551 RepID=A0ABW4UUE7_9BACL
MSDMGRPLRFESVEHLQHEIDDYFNSCYEEVWYEIEEDDGQKSWRPSTDRFGQIEKQQVKPFTVSGLAYYLGTNRQTLMNYSERPEFIDTIKKAKARIEGYVEETLLTSKNPAGSIFNLKNNYGWVDKQEVDQTLSNKEGESFSVASAVKQLTVEELRKLAQSKSDDADSS